MNLSAKVSVLETDIIMNSLLFECKTQLSSADTDTEQIKRVKAH